MASKNTPDGYWTYERVREAALPFEYKADFRANSPNACSVAYNNGWIDDFTWLKEKRKPNGYWEIYENCYNAAKECETRAEFADKYSRAYASAKRHGWIDDYDWFLSEEEARRRVHQKTNDDWIAEAKEVWGDKYDYSQSEYKGSHKKVKIICPEHGPFEVGADGHLHRGIGCPLCKRDKQAEFIAKCIEAQGEYGDDYSKVDYIDANHKVCIIIGGEERWFYPKNYLSWKRDRKQPIFWTEETALEHSHNYSSFAEMQKDREGNGESCYNYIAKNKLQDKITWFKSTFDVMSEAQTQYTPESCRERALECSSKSGFNKKYPGAWKYANRVDENGVIIKKGEKKKKLIDTFDWFKTPMTPHTSTHYVIYVYIDYDNNMVYVGLSKNVVGRHKQHKFGKKEHGVVTYDRVWKYFNSIGKEVPDYVIKMDELTAEEAQYYEDWYEKKYKEAGWNVLNKAKCGSLGGNWIIWTEEKITEHASKFNSRSEFSKGDNRAYKMASKYRLLDKLFPKAA